MSFIKLKSLGGLLCVEVLKIKLEGNYWGFFYSWMYIGGFIGRKEMFYLMTHSTHFIYGYMASDIW